MIGEGLFLGHRHMPAGEIVKESARIANAAEGQKRPGACFTRIFFARIGPEPELTKAKQLCLRIEDGERLSISSFNDKRIRLSRDHQNIRAPASGNWLAQRTSGEQPLFRELA